MAVGQRVTVNDSADLLDANTGGGRSMLVRNRGAVAVYLGGIDVTSSTGFQLDPGEAVSIDTSGSGPGGGLYAITASGSAVVHVLQG